MTESDPLLRRIERTAVLTCGAMAVTAAVISPGHVAAALGVLGGGAIAAISYRGIKAGVDAVAGAMQGGSSGGMSTAVGLVKFFTRYAILAIVAYAIMARLRLPPVAVVAGASSLVVAVMVEALRRVVPGQR